MSVETELFINRRQTLLFIAARPLTVALLPTIRTKTTSGGFLLSDGPARDADTFRLIEQASAYGNSPGLLQSQDGKQRRVTFQLLGSWQSIIEVGDHWISDGMRFEVAELLPYNGYERRGRVVQYG